MLCVFCGETSATTKDHTPPQCFFPRPLPENMITVPTCDSCNDTWSNDADLARNWIVSLESTEPHKAIEQILGTKRNRSWRQGNHGRAKVKAFLSSLVTVDRYSEGGVYLGKSTAINLDQEAMDTFFDRLTRGLLHHKTKCGYIECSIEWRLGQDIIDKIPDEIKDWISRSRRHTLGNVFEYTFSSIPGSRVSYWVYRFYGKQEFFIKLKRAEQELS